MLLAFAAATSYPRPTLSHLQVLDQLHWKVPNARQLQCGLSGRINLGLVVGVQDGEQAGIGGAKLQALRDSWTQQGGGEGQRVEGRQTPAGLSSRR